MTETIQKTKDQNTFRFKSFGDRVNEIDLRSLALYHIGHQNEVLSEEENETFFHQTLKKWMVLNLTEEFNIFSRKCQRIVTLPQLIHQKDVVIDALLDRLATATNLSLQPLLEILYVLARDLREEFYPYFQRVLDRLICLLNTDDAEKLEWTFVCLAYMFKALKPHLKRNIGVVFHSILPLLDEQRYPAHITNFAVECFSFIARDVLDYKKFLYFILATVAREQVQSVQGCGRLLFEMVRGVKGQFHSTAGEFLHFTFSSLIDEQGENEEQTLLLCDIVDRAIQELLKFIYPQNIGLMWEKLCDVAGTIKNAKKILQLTPIFLRAVSYKNGKQLAEMDMVVPIILKMIEKCIRGQEKEALRQLANIVSKIVLSTSTQVTQLDTSRLMKKMLTVDQRDIYDEFVLLVVAHPQFELLILPGVVNYFEKHFDLQSLDLLARIVLEKQPLALNGIGIQQWRQYPLHLKNETTLEKIKKRLKASISLEQKKEDLEEFLLLCILAPHLKPLDRSSIESNIKDTTAVALKQIEMSPEEDVEKYFQIFALIFETAVHLDFVFSKDFSIKCASTILPHIKNIHALDCLDMLLTLNEKCFREQKEDLSNKISTMLSTNDHRIRLTAAHCLQSLYKTEVSKTPYVHIFNAERIEPDLHNYREHLLHLQKLQTASELYKSFNLAHYKEDILHFLLGNLYQNFKFVWEPTLQLIEEYAKVMPIEDFWLIYKAQLEKTASAIGLIYTQNKDVPNVQFENISENWNSKALCQTSSVVKVSSLNEQELFNHRNLLWQRLPKFGTLIEVKNRELVTLFFRFIDEEYRPILEKRDYFLDLLNSSSDERNSQVFEAIIGTDTDSDGEEDGQENEKTPKKILSLHRKTRTKSNSLVKSLLQTLQTKMTIFIAQPNPKALYRESEIYALHMELLAAPNPSTQKLALDCVMAYKCKALLAYKERLYGMIDEQKFKDELVQLKLDTVPSEYRGVLMEILLRILYGKMLTRGTQRSISTQVRKSLILRFLGQCNLDEIFWFLRMALGRYSKYAEKSIEIKILPQLVQKDFSLNAICSPKKLKALVNLLELVRKEFGGIMNLEFHEFMLKLLVFVGCCCHIVIDAATDEKYKQNLHPKIPIVFRNIKNAALSSLVNFFIHIENFDWQSEQLNCLIDVFVKPTIARLPHECIHTPTPLLKLLLQWGEHPRFYDCLSHQIADDQHTIFYYLIQLLLNERAKAPVRKPIMSVIANLLNSASNNENDQRSNIALAIVKPFIPQILQRLKLNLGVHQSLTRQRRLKVEKQDLNILSLLTTHVDDSTTCDTLLQLLLPVLMSKVQSSINDESVVCQVIMTLSNLIKRLDEPETYLVKIAPLFEFVLEINARKMLCGLIVDVASKRLKQAKKDTSIPSDLCERLKDITRITLMLNAWDKRWVEQPDYDKRLDALKEVSNKLENNEINIDLGILVVYNCCYFLRFDKDMGLRDNAGEHLRLIFPKLTKQFASEPKKVEYLVGDIFINLVRRLIRDANDNIRNEGLHLLGTMVRHCPEAHPILNDMAPLADKLDEEVDFFENLTHLQSHRHGRALLKFCSYAEKLKETPTTRTLTEFILPLSTRYLLQEKYAAKHTLVDAAIETVGVVCQLLPWQQYHTILRYYLQKMRHTHDFQKQCVRIVVRILDAFHFDLSNAQGLKPQQIESEVLNPNEPQKSDVTNSKEDEELEENLEEALEDVSEEIIDLADESITKPDNKIADSVEFILKKPTKLSTSASKRVLSTITCVLIPTLNRTITEKSQYDMQHKINRRRVGFEREEEEILRVPIALALVKLIQKLPKELMDSSLPGVFMKVCTFLRSPLKSVRMLTRDILKKIITTLGGSYLSLLIEHLQSLLTRGFQVHVLSVTIHGVLDALRGKLQAGDIDSCLGNILEVALNDIFGDIAAEKEVQKIASHTPEAKPSAKSYIVLHIAARNIQESCLLDLLMPFKEHLARSHARKLVLKIQECFAKIVTGLAENPNISIESLLVFIYGMISESITDLLPGTEKRILSEKEKEKMRRARPDCYIIQPVPQRRMGAINKNVKSNAQANAHILIEFGLEMLNIILKRKKLMELDYEAFLNPLLPLLRDSLKSTYARVTTFTLKCFAAIWNNGYTLPELDKYLPDIVTRMFEILKNLSTFGASKQEDNLQLMKATLKAMVCLLRQCPQFTFTTEQVDHLILHIEQDLYEGEKQPVSFALLKAMVGRKVDTASMHDILKKISELSITSHSDYVRDECRNILLTYVMEYQLNKRIDQIIKNFSVQLCYSESAGRLSAIQFLAAVIKRFPQNILSKRAEFLYLSLGTRLVNDDDSTCRKAIAECIESLISHLDKGDRSRLFELTMIFFKEAQKPSVREMAACLCSRFLNVEKRAFNARMRTVFPIIVGRLTLNDPRVPGRFVRAPLATNIEVESSQNKSKRLKETVQNGVNESIDATLERKQRAVDHEIIQTQYCIHKMLEHCLSDLFATLDESLLNNVDELAYSSQRLLAHDHAWVRCNAAKTISQILAHYDFALVGQQLCNPKAKLTGAAQFISYIYSEPESEIKSLVLDLCAQIIPGDTPQTMVDEIVKIFLLIANMLRNVPLTTKQEQEAEGENEKIPKMNLKWLVGKIRFLIFREVAKAPHATSVRTALFNLIEGLITIVSPDTMKELSPMILLVLVREMSEDDQQIDLDLRQLALHVGARLRKCIGSDTYDKLRAQAQKTLLIRRAERKKLIAQEKIHDPVRAAKRKIAIQERKKVAKKRKNDVMRGKVEDVKQKLKKRKRKAESSDLF